MDYPELKYTVACLQFILPGATIRRFYQFDHRSIGFSIQPKNKEPAPGYLLIFDGKTSYQGLYLSSQTPGKEFFSQLSRSFEKKLGGSEILSIQMPYPDRILVLETSLPEWPAHRYIWLEFFGSKSNVVIVDGKDGKILDCLLKIPESSPTHPLRMPGRAFKNSFEHSRLKTNPLSTLIDSPEKWPETGGIDELSTLLLNNWVPMTPRFSKELATTKMTGGILAASEKIHDFLSNRSPESPEQAITHLTRLSEARENRIYKDTFHQTKQHIKKTVMRALKRVEKLKDDLKADYQKLENYKELQKKADLLAINYHHIHKGMAEIRVPDVVDPDSAEITIELNSEKSPKENLDILYRKAAKTKRAEPVISARLAILQTEIQDLKNLLDKIERAENLEHISNLTDILEKAGFLSELPFSVPQKAMLTSRPYHRFISIEGFDIWVGRNALENSMLSFKDAAPHDFWLHAKDYHGAHVILKNPRKSSDPPSSSLEYAAQLAVFYSKARGEKRVSVIYTKRKYIRPAGGNVPGRVIVKHHKTIQVDSPIKSS